MINKFKNISFKIKLIIIIITSILLALIPLDFLLIYNFNKNAEQQLANDINNNTLLISKYLVAPLTLNDYEGAESILSNCKEINSIQFAYIISPTNELIASFQNNNFKNYKSSELLRYDKSKLYRSKYKILFKSFNYGNLYVYSSKSKIVKSTNDYILFLFLIQAIVLTIVSFVIFKLASIATKPIIELTYKMQSFKVDDPDFEKVIYQSDDEIGKLYDKFNQLVRSVIDSNSQKNIAQNALIKTNANLEHTVNQRTQMLTLTNVNLNEEIISRKQTEIKLQEANKEKDKFISILAHDIRNPLAGINLGLDLLQDNIESNNYNKIDRITKLKLSIKQIDLLIENVLLWIKSTGGSLIHRPNNINLNEIIINNIDLHKDLANGKNIQLINNINNNFISYSDYDMINVVIRNIISNCIKFTKSNGTISIDMIDNGDYIELSILDSGIGMSKEQIEAIISNGTHTTTSGTINEKGTGLGLILCKEFIEINNGSLWIESELGKGTKFIILLQKEVSY